MRMWARRLGYRSVASDSDEVVVACPLPANGRMNGVKGQVKVVGTEGIPYNTGVAYGFSGFVIPVQDPDTQVTWDTLWDTYVPKDTAETAGAFDLDTGTPDTNPEFEIGHPDLQGMFDANPNAPVEIFRKRKILTLADTPIGYEKVDAGNDLFTPTDRFALDVGRNLRVRQPALIAFALSSPAFHTVGATIPSTPTEAQWMMLQYAETFLEDMLKNLLGLVEAGAETPYEEASDFLAEFLESAVLEENVNGWTNTVFNVWCQATFDITVPGRVAVGGISSEG